MLLCAVAAWLPAQEAAAVDRAQPGPFDPLPPSLPRALLPDPPLEGAERAWAVGLSGAAVCAGMGWSLYEAWAMLDPAFAVLGEGELADAGSALAEVAADPEFQGRLFGLGFGLVATALASNLLDLALRGPERGLMTR